MRKILLIWIGLLLLIGVPGYAEEKSGSGDKNDQESSVWLEDEPIADTSETEDGVSSAWVDPLEPINRAVFTFNDWFYFGFMKPVANVYGTIVPSRARICIRNTFQNVYVPVRLVNNALQGKFLNSGVEISRFLINTTVGIAGLFDPAKEYFHLNPSEEDLGQTLGAYGIGDRIYLCLPFLGPSTLRDSVGLGGDYLLSPISYLTMSDWRAGFGAWAGETVNSTSLLDNEYEKLKQDSFDFYVAIRDGYLQHRRHKVEE